MFVVIALMLVGIFIGYSLRNKKMIWIGHIITVLIWFLLLILGVEVGANKDVINNISTLGIEAFIIAIAAVLGSIVAAKLLWNWIKQKDKMNKP